MQWRKVNTFVMPAAPEVSCWQEDGVSQQVHGEQLVWLVAAFWTSHTAFVQEALAGLTVLLCLRCLLKRCGLEDVCKVNCSSGSEPAFYLCLGGLLGENDVWEQTDTQSPWVIPCVPSMLFCLLGWDANVMNFN